MTDRGAEVLGAGLPRAMGSGGEPFLNKKWGVRYTQMRQRQSQQRN